MITPKFTITQNDEFVLVTIKVPHIRISSAELLTEDNTFSFYCKPYLLKLTFPHKFKEEDEECKATYDPFCENGTLTAYLPKLEYGQHFPDLDLTSKLLQIQRHSSQDIPSIPRIEVLKSEGAPGADEDVGEICTNLEDDEMDTVNELPDILRAVKQVQYGFNNQYSNVFTYLREELMDMTEIKHPDSILPQYRTVLRVAAENQQFDPDRYLGDNLGGETDPIYMEAMSYKTFYTKQWDAWKTNKTKKPPVHSNTHETTSKLDHRCGSMVEEDPRVTAFDLIGGFSDLEKDILTSKLGNREYLIPSGSNQEFALLLGLADILFAYSYDHRLTLGESTVESAHTISRLSCTFSWLEDYLYHIKHAAMESAKLSEAVETRDEAVRRSILFSLRRCVIHPYLRVWKLARKVLADVAKILFLGKRAILKCLLQVYATFEHTDTHYLLNKIYITDYCIWLQSSLLSSETLQSFAKSYNCSKGGIEQLPCEGKELMGFYLPEIENWASEQVAETESDETSSYCSNNDSGSDSDSDSESGSSGTSGSDTGTRNSTDGDAATDSVEKLQDTKAEIEEQEMDVEMHVPNKYTDYQSLQRTDPQLEYLAMWGLSSELSNSLLGTIPQENTNMHIPNPASTDCHGKVRPITDVDASNMLLLPKRKVDFQEEEVSGATSAGPPKRVLIEDITPPPPPGTPAKLSPIEGASSTSLRTLSSDASSVKSAQEGPDGVLHELSNLSISKRN